MHWDVGTCLRGEQQPAGSNGEKKCVHIILSIINAVVRKLHDFERIYSLDSSLI